MNIVLKNKLLYLLFFLLIIFEFLIFSNLFSNSFIYLDDVDTALCDSFKNILKEPSNGIFISGFFDNLFTTCLPRLFDIHPSTFKGQFFCYIESLFIISFIFIFNAILRIDKKFNLFFFSTFIFCSSILFFIAKQQANVLFVYDGFFRMLLPAFMFVGLFYLLVTSSENLSKKKIILISSMIFLICTSNEMLCVSTLIGILFYTIFQIKNKNFYTLFWVLCAILGCLVLVKTGTFLRKSDGNFPNVFDYFFDFIPFLFDYIKYIFGKHIVEISLIIFQIIFLFIKKSKEENVQKTCLLILSFFIGILSFFFSLKLLGRTHYEEGEYWIIHADLHMIYSFILFAFIFTLIRLIINYKLIQNKVFISIFLISSLFLNISNFYFYKEFLENQIKPLKKEYYKLEKIIRLASIKNQKAFLNDELCDDIFFWPFFENINERRSNVNYSNSPFITFINQFEKEKINIKYVFTDENTAKNFLKENGGVFNKKEFENIDFNKLKDKNFILNKT